VSISRSLRLAPLTNLWFESAKKRCLTKKSLG